MKNLNHKESHIRYVSFRYYDYYCNPCLAYTIHGKLITGRQLKKIINGGTVLHTEDGNYLAHKDLCLSDIKSNATYMLYIHDDYCEGMYFFTIGER